MRGGTTGPSRIVRAIERSNVGATFVYDMTIDDDAGTCEVWRGLRLKAIGPLTPERGWPVALLGPLLERLTPAAAGIRVLAAECADRPGSGRALISRLTGGTVGRRNDGRPEAAGAHVSAAHAGGIGLAIAGPNPVACDIEPIASRSASAWRRLLGDAAILHETTSGREDLDVAATRIWCVRECLHKVGRPTRVPLSLRDQTRDTMTFRAENLDVVTRRIPVRGAGTDFIVALAREAGGAPSEHAAHEASVEVS